ncbi:MAG TPA: MoxR family ATPase [bacterium]|jgi:MoxR-like ATPase|nr:MoxR family ATPase [Dictyoglomota bacterium]HHV81312.1 MoxR family ATPase [bacterium]HOL54777.1 MoxR family ATPase [bacterium]HON72328.1 MoxR family ATPase [bacterium]HOP56174.1 MoxR family ATPase [bacterium]
MDIDLFVRFKSKIIENVSRVIVGKDEVIELVTVAFICGGHILLEDVPGLGKTLLVKAFAKTIGCDFKRIQFTPDLLPSDLTGINFYNQKTGDFQFRPGPIFTNILLADEINRATPRTQSALLEAMQEQQVTVDGVTRKLPEPFMVLATQNPIESYGTFPLPEAQLDRFFMRIKIGYPTRREEIEIVNRNKRVDLTEGIESVVSTDEIKYVRSAYNDVKISEEVMDYLLDIIEKTRNMDMVQLGVSPRGTIALFKASQAYAAINGRDYIIPEDIKKMAPHVLNHRVILKGLTKDRNIYSFINSVLETVRVPVEEV